MTLGMDQELTFKLTLAEAITLSHCLDRLNKMGHFKTVVDQAEQVALWALDNILERENPVIFSSDYAEHLREAKTHLTRRADV